MEDKNTPSPLETQEKNPVTPVPPPPPPLPSPTPSPHKGTEGEEEKRMIFDHLSCPLLLRNIMEKGERGRGGGGEGGGGIVRKRKRRR